MEATLAQIAEAVGGELRGDGARAVVGICPPDAAVPDRLCVVWKRELLAGVPRGVPVLAASLDDGRDGVLCAEPRLAMPRLLPMFDMRVRPEPGVHPTAVIDGEIGDGVHIGPFCTVSRGARVGDGTVLIAGVFVGEGTTVGRDCRLEAGVALLDLVELGDRVAIHAGTKVGCDGFGFVPRADGTWEKMPQIGTVVIEDDVEIGANCTIDRAMFGATRIGRGTKIGAMTHIAHNCEVGRNCVMSGFTGFAGTVKVGDNTVIAGLVGIADHVTVGSRVTIAGRSGVTKDIPDGATVAGYPAQPHGRENRYQASLRRVPDLLRRVKELEAEVARLGGEAR